MKTVVFDFDGVVRGTEFRVLKAKGVINEVQRRR